MLFFCFGWTVLNPQLCLAQKPAFHNPLVTNGGYIVQTGSTLIEHRPHELFTPASTLKILTSLAALTVLGEGYQFETHFFIDLQNNLYIKGYGDPFLTSEAILDIAHALRKRNITKISSIYLDSSSFNLAGEIAGESNSANPYDAPNSALAVNFNSLPIQVLQDGTVLSGEPQTPTIPLMEDIAKHLGPGRHRVNVAAFAPDSDSISSVRYAGELFTAIFKSASIRCEGVSHRGTVPPTLKPVYIHYGRKTAKEAVKSCLRYSNNFIANQLFLVSGAQVFNFPATWDKSRSFLTAFISTTLALPTDEIVFQEGSGLSRLNQMSPAALITILNHFKPYAELLNHRGDILIKSGTLEGVYCYAGYFAINKELIPYTLLLNQPKNTRDALLQELLKKTLSLKVSDK